MASLFEQIKLLHEIVLGIEFLACLVALFYFFRLKNSYWKWFCIYLILIFVQEFFWFPYKLSFAGITKPVYADFLGVENPQYYAFFGIPVQYLFFFWLFALKSLKNKKLFLSFSFLYIAAFIPIELYNLKLNVVHSHTLTVGTLLLSILVVLVFLKQIRTGDILNLKKNKMLYITIGVILFYIGTYPFFAFYELLYLKHKFFWDWYYLYFAISNCIMYLLLIVPFRMVYREELLRTRMEIQLATMRYIGREIHDNVGQKLTLSSLYLQQMIFENKAPQMMPKLKTVNGIVDESLNILKHLSRSLTDDTIRSHSISELIQNECEKVDDLAGYRIIFTTNSHVHLTSYQVKSVLLRITQEFLQNSIKHAHCKNIFVSLEKVKKYLQLVLRDDGKGFNTDALKTKGIGLKNIKKRIELINGTFHLESRQHSGTTLTIKIPI